MVKVPVSSVPGCDDCPMRQKFPDNTFVAPERHEGSKRLVIAEAPGKTEAEEGRPLVGGSGRIFDALMRKAGVSRESLTIANVMNCFLSPRTAVLTPTGYEELGKLKTGDQVLTHLGRFKSVISVVKPLMKCSEYVEISTQQDTVRVTPDHRFFNGVSWVYAGELKVGDSISVLSERCIECGASVTRAFKFYGRSMPFCNITCHNRFVAKKSTETIRRVMLESYANGTRNRFAITKAANAAFRRLIKEGWHPPGPSEEGKMEGRIKAALARQAINIQRNLPYVGFGEMEVADILENAGVQYQTQFAIDSFNYDFKVGKTLLEIDGPSARNKVRRERDTLKTRLAESKGYRVLHIPNNASDSVLELLKNDAHTFEFVETKILSIARKPWNRSVWTLAVEDDESYVAQGLVNHNCRPPDNAFPDSNEARAYCTKEEGQQIIKHCIGAHVKPLLNIEGWDRVDLLGEKALRYIGKQEGGINRWRGSIIEIDTEKI